MEDYYFPFGQPVLPRAPSIAGSRPLYVLGAYPSALHIYWEPPSTFKKIQAIAIDNEPDSFWDGQDEQKYFLDWVEKVDFKQSWGNAHPAGKFNGNSGCWVTEQVIAPLGFARTQTWLSDCLDTYRCSEGLSSRIEDTYAPFARQAKLSIAKLLPHPSEYGIVSESVEKHLPRLKNEIISANPDVIVTLGNAALRVLPHVLTVEDAIPRTLSALPHEYGNRLKVKINNDKYAEWIPLAHPAAPENYQKAHQEWLGRRK